MTDRPAYRDGIATALVRSGVFAFMFVVVFLSLDPAMGNGPGPLALALAAIALAADAVIAWLGGARGMALIRTAGATALVWIVLGLLPYLTEVVSGWLPGAGPSGAAILLMLLCLAVAAVAWLPRTQAVWSWLMLSLATASGIAASGTYYFPEPAPALPWIAFALAASAIGALGQYVRRVVEGRLGWRGLSRVALLAGVVLFSVVVSTTATAYVGRLAVRDQTVVLLSTREQYLRRAARQLSGLFPASQLASATPELRSEVLRLAALGGVGLSIYDNVERRVVLAVRRTGVPLSGANDPAEAPDGTRGYPAFTAVTLEADEVREVVNAPMVFTVENDLVFGALPSVATAIGYSDGTAAPTSHETSSGTGYILDDAENPDGDRFTLVAGDADGLWTSGGAVTVDDVSNDMSLTMAPWLFFAFVLPCTLGLLALDRRDVARAKLVASEERARLNRDAHDRVYNRLTALANRLAAAESPDVAGPPPSAEIRRTVADLQGILGDGVSAAGPVAVDAVASLLADVCADQARLWDLTVSLEGADALNGIDPRVGWELQCIAEEALTNVGRHSEATAAIVRFSREEEVLVLEIADDGRGITEPLDDSGMPIGATGMRGMADRARTMGGTLNVATGPSGTSVTVRVPL